MDMMELLRFLWLKNRSLVTDDMDASLLHLKQIFPDMKVHAYPTGLEAWTWIVPPKWVVRDAFIETLDGRRILSFSEHPLSLVSYSEPFDGEVSKEELLRHLHSSETRPAAFPYVFKYYERDWGLCMPHERVLSLDQARYRVKIDTAFEPGMLKVGELVIPGETEESIVIVTDICHPGQVNDSITGVVVAAAIGEKLLRQSNNYTFRILFLPETIGSICYLSQNEDFIPHIKCALFFEMLGTTGEHVLGHSYPGTSKLDRVAYRVLQWRTDKFHEARFREVAPSDEKVFNGPGVGIPTINITRAPYPYPEYHTSDDSPDIIHPEKLEESRDLIFEILRVMDTDFVPIRQFRGPAFLSRYGLWVDWQKNWALNMAVDLIMLFMDGQHSVFEITDKINREFDIKIQYEEVRDYVNRMIEKGLVARSTLSQKI
jgi:aminopeptidase-like protein